MYIHILIIKNLFVFTYGFTRYYIVFLGMIYYSVIVDV